MTKEQIKRKIERAVARLAGIRANEVAGLVSGNFADGKLYEAHVLAYILEKMVKEEGLRVIFRPGADGPRTRIALRSKGGPLVERFPHFDLIREGVVVGELWTDIEFYALSFTLKTAARAPTPGDFHELDLIVVKPNTRGKPFPDDILLGVECKDMSYGKDKLRQVLGVRRELSYYADPKRTAFRNWPRSRVKADPPSCLLVFCSYGDAKNFEEPGKVFGIDFIHETMD